MRGRLNGARQSIRRRARSAFGGLSFEARNAAILPPPHPGPMGQIGHHVGAFSLPAGRRFRLIQGRGRNGPRTALQAARRVAREEPPNGTPFHPVIDTERVIG